jgi:hypothetical protein
MKSSFKFILLLSLSLNGVASEKSCLGTNSEKFDVLSENVCTVASAQIANDLGEDKERFDKIYSGKKNNYQDRLINGVANVESRAEKNNRDLWYTAQLAAIGELFSRDEKGRIVVDPALNKIIQKTLNMDETRAAAHIKDYIQPHFTGKKTELNPYGNMSLNLQQKIFNELTSNPEFAETLNRVKANAKEALSSVPNNSFQEKDVDISFESAKKTNVLRSEKNLSPDQKDYWVDNYKAENPFLDQNSQSYEVHYKAYIDYKEKLIAKENKRSTPDPKKLRKELASIELGDPKRVSFTPPAGVNIDDFYNQIKDGNPTYFNCRVSYTADAEIQNKIISKSLPKNDSKEEISSMPSVQAKTCKLQNNFGDDQYAMSDDMSAEVQSCLNDIPADAINVQIEVESCASTVRTNKEEFNKSNLLLSKKRGESIQNLIPKDKGYAVSLNYQGENKMIDQNGNLNPTGTCGPWVQGIGDYKMNPTTCINSMKSADGYCDNTPAYRIKSEGFYWLCNQVDGRNYNDEMKESLKKHRYNTIKISYELKPKPVIIGEDKPFDPSHLPDDQKLSYIESTPHITCLFPRLKHEGWTSLSDRMKDSWRDFSEYISTLSFPAPVGGGESHVKSNGLCAAYH